MLGEKKSAKPAKLIVEEMVEGTSRILKEIADPYA
jgi:hypothetical protein